MEKKKKKKKYKVMKYGRTDTDLFEEETQQTYRLETINNSNNGWKEGSYFILKESSAILKPNPSGKHAYINLTPFNPTFV